MKNSQALKIILLLADGIDPSTGECFDSDSPYQNPNVMRGLFKAARVLESQRVITKSKKNSPASAGTPWNDNEDRQLIIAFKKGAKLADLAKKHQRSKGAIQSRLMKHRLFEDEAT